MKLNELEDDELIFFIRLQSNEALSVLMDRYKMKSIMLAKEFLAQFPHSGISLDTLVYIGLDCITRSMDQYQESKSSFYTYWRNTALRDFGEYFQTNSYMAKGNMFVGLSLDAFCDENDDKTGLISNIVGDVDKVKEGDEIMDDVEKFLNTDTDYFKGNEKSIFLSYLHGFEISEIKEAFHTTKSRIYRIIEKGKKLLLRKFSK